LNISYNDKNLPATLEHAENLIEKARWTEAFDLLQNLCSCTDRPRAHELLGRAAAALEHWDISANAYAHVVQQDQASRETWVGLSTALDELGRLESAIKAYDVALTLEPGDIETRTKRAFVSLRLGDIGAALAQFEIVIEAGLPQSRADRAALLCDLNSRDKLGNPSDQTWRALGIALAALNAAAAGDPNNQARKQVAKLAGILRDLGHLEAGLIQFDHAIALGSIDSGPAREALATLHTCRGQLLESLDRPAHAEDAYRSALELAHNKTGPARELGRILSDRGNFEEAAACFVQAICGPVDEQDASFDNYFGGLANSQIAEIVIDRQHLHAYEMLAQLLHDMGREDEARFVQACTSRLKNADTGPSVTRISTTDADGAGYATDKISTNEQSLAVYEEVFSPFVDQPIVLLELGIREGGSLLMWRDYFQFGSIVGLDVHPSPIADVSGRIHTYQGYQEDLQLLDRIASERAPEGYSIVIDDASHRGDLTRITFEHVFHNHLKPGGVYVIEDWQSGYLSTWPDGREYAPQADVIETTADGKSKRRLPSHDFGMVGFVKQLLDQSNQFDRVLVAKNRVFVFKEAAAQ
jgi:tetratricopeptide (TPR) repeat protein